MYNLKQELKFKLRSRVALVGITVATLVLAYVIIRIFTASSPIAPTSAVMPTAANTGSVLGPALTLHSGDYVMKTDGSNISNLHITGNLYLAANNLTVTNVQVDGNIGLNSAPGGNYFYPVKRNHSLSYVSARSVWSVGLDTVTFDHCHFGNTADTFMQLADNKDSNHLLLADRLIIKNSLFDNLRPLPPGGGWHLEAIHLMGVTHVALINNVFDYRPPDQDTANYITATLNLGSSNTPADSLALDGNWLYGGGWHQLYFLSSAGVIKNNRFSTYRSPDGSISSSIIYPGDAYNSADLQPYGGTYPEFQQSGNTLDGKPVSL
jgi:hypothetical protein